MSSSQQAPIWTYGGLSLAACVLLSILLYLLGGSGAVFVPVVLFVVAIVTRRAFLMYVMPFVVLGTVCVTFMFDGLQVSALDGLILALLTLTALGTCSRLHDLMFPRLDRLLTEHVIYSPTNHFKNVRVAGSHLISLVIVVAAWRFAGYLNADFAAAVQSREFEEYRIQISRTYRMVPWAYCLINFILVLACIFSITHGLLSYWRCRSNTGMMAGMLLRHELWRWNGKEQRRIAKAMRRGERR